MPLTPMELSAAAYFDAAMRNAVAAADAAFTAEDFDENEALNLCQGVRQNKSARLVY